MGIKLKWSARIHADSQRIYRDIAPFTDDSLPSEIASIDGSIGEYLDAVPLGVPYYYAVEAVKDGRKRLSELAVTSGITDDYGVDGIRPVRILDFAAGCYTDDGVGKSFSDLNTYTRTGITWAWQLVAGSLELVEIADGVAPFSVDPETGLAIGVDVMPAVTRSNIRYMPTAAQIFASGSPTLTDLTLSALGHFAGVKVESGGSVSDYARSQVSDNVNLTSGTPQAFEFLIREDDLGVVRIGFQAQTSGNTLILEYTFATNAMTVWSATSGTVSLEKGIELADGTHRITGIFTPNATDGYKAIWLPNSGISGAGFISLAWFIYGSAITYGRPPPILGPQGATYSTNDAALTGTKTVGTEQTLVVFGKRLTHKTNWADLAHWSDSSTPNDNIQIDVHLKNTNPRMQCRYNAFGDIVFYPSGPSEYTDRWSYIVSCAENIQRAASYTSVLFQQEKTEIRAAYNLDNYGIGCTPSGAGVAGATIEKMVLFDVQLTQDQMAELAQRGFLT